MVHHAASFCILAGASAMQLWGTTRATRDVDILIDATVENAKRVLAALGELGFGFAKEFLADESTFQLEGVPIPTASLDHLIASKRTGRLQGAADVEVLEEITRLHG